MKYTSSGIPHLDEILGSGLPKPSLILIAGTAGVGKTTLALQSLSKAAENGETAVYLPITSQSMEKLTQYLHSYPFFNDNIIVHPIDRSTAEKDPLTTLLDIGNILASTNPDRLVVNPLTTLGFGFSDQERRRFFYSFDSMLQDWSAQTFVTGEMNLEEVENSILSHISDGVIYMDREKVGNKLVRKLDIIKLRGMAKAAGDVSSSIEFKIGPEGISIFPKLRSFTSNLSMNGQKLSTGVEGLDDMMHGGLPRRSAVLVVGGPGVGKTMMGLQFIVEGIKLDEPGVIVMFEEQKDQMIFEASKFGWDLQDFINKGLLRIIHAHPHDLSPDEHNLEIKTSVEEIGAKRLFFDGVYNLGSALTDPAELREHIRLLIDYLKYQGVTMVLTNEVSELFNLDRMPDMGISSLADAIILMHYMEEHHKLDRMLSILKLRGSDHDRTLRKYTICDQGIEII